MVVARVDAVAAVHVVGKDAGFPNLKLRSKHIVCHSFATERPDRNA